MQPKSAVIVFACVLLALACNLATAQERLESSAGTTGATAEDITIGILNKEKLEQEIEQLKKKNASFWTNYLNQIATPISIVGALVVGLFGVFRWFHEQRDERDKRDEDRFQAVVSGLGSADDGAKASAAIMLHTFIAAKGYERFLEQAFGLAVSHLRLARPADPDKPTELSPLGLALITTFRTAYPRARANWIKKRGEKYDVEEFHRTFDASYINLDKAYLWRAELPDVFMPNASMKGTDLSEANLRSAQLWYGHFHKAILRGTDLEKADLGVAKLIEADLSKAKLGEAILWAANLHKATLRGTDLSRARLYGEQWDSGAALQGADLRNARLEEADLRAVNLEEANLCGANLTKAKLERAILAKAKYNSREMREVAEQGKAEELVIGPTQWPLGFQPTGAVDVLLESGAGAAHFD